MAFRTVHFERGRTLYLYRTDMENCINEAMNDRVAGVPPARGEGILPSEILLIPRPRLAATQKNVGPPAGLFKGLFLGNGSRVEGKKPHVRAEPCCPEI
jgi:hypothetical protein